MLQQFASYIFSSITNSEATSTEPEPIQENSINDRLTSVETEDEWVLVDRERRNSEGLSERSSSVESIDLEDDYQLKLKNDDLSESDDDEDMSMVRPYRSHSTGGHGSISLTDLWSRSETRERERSSPSVYHSFNTGMEESWFITPPPCFISTGPVHMETSPLENLLIEHPSMSVYRHHSQQRRQPLQLRRPPLVEIIRPAIEIIHKGPTFPEQRIARRNIIQRQRAAQQRLRIQQEQQKQKQEAEKKKPERRVNNLPLVQVQEQQVVKKNQAQKMQIKQSSKNMQRNYLDRNNKAREVNCRNRRQRRGERSQGAQRSFANNNRKC